MSSRWRFLSVVRRGRNGNNNTRHTHNVLQCPCYVVTPVIIPLDIDMQWPWTLSFGHPRSPPSRNIGKPDDAAVPLATSPRLVAPPGPM